MNNVKKSIGWANFSINPVKGLCPVDCKDNQGKSFCYARRLYKRFKWSPVIRYDPSVFLDLPSKPSRIFVGSTMELFGEWVLDGWMQEILAICEKNKEHIFLFLTKKSHNLRKFSPFPGNCWVGASATDTRMALEACLKLGDIEAKIRYLSLEPMLNSINLPPELLTTCKIGWLIIGAQTNPTVMPKLEWIDEIATACKKANIPYFEKNNLATLLNRKLVQQFPES